MSSPLALARMRALRTVRVPFDPGEFSALESAAQLAARRIIGVVDGDGVRALMLGWAPEYDPGSVFGAERGYLRDASPTALLILAACIRCCWPDPSESLYPGCAATEDEVLDALERFTNSAGSGEASQNAVRRVRKGAIRQLRGYGLLAPESDDGTVRLGPEIATWSDPDVSQLRSRYDDLPAVGRDRP